VPEPGPRNRRAKPATRNPGRNAGK
jgi:hypothetical protein